MPEGPEVRRYADALGAALEGEQIVSISARTRAAKAWLAEHPDTLPGRAIERVWSRGKNLIGRIEGGYFWYSHLMMWGRWEVIPGPEPAERDRRERARVVTPSDCALLFNAPVFEVGEGDPFRLFPYLASLGPDILPYPGEGPFAAECFTERLLSDPRREVGAALLDQTIVAGIGNYLRAEILFLCRLDPFRKIGDLTSEQVDCLCRTIPRVAEQTYTSRGRTVTEADQERVRQDATLRYPNAGEWSSSHYVFRRTNLPCLTCGDTVRQTRQVTWQGEDGDEMDRIIYFCPTCQERPAPERKPANRKQRAKVLPEEDSTG